jgi:hypothetical protein|nr:MAG TPA: hypothetical protein [Caudoviricetes sp.]
MNIDKEKLKLGIWYEDENGNVINQKEDLMCKAPEKARTYHCCFPLQITECIYAVHSKSQKETCKHKRKYWKKDTGLIKGLKGHICTNCGCSQTRKWWQPWGRKWDYGTDITSLIDLHTSIGGANQDVIMAMVNSGDYTLQEALVVFSTACERCMNALAYKYLNGAYGYEEYSDEWKKCNTECDFCKIKEDTKC